MHVRCGDPTRGRRTAERAWLDDVPKRTNQPSPRFLLVQLRVGDRLVSESGEWVVTGRPFTTAGGKTAHARVNKVNQPDVTEIRSWGAHERVAVKRA
jgi:hypothetical protein